MRSMLGAIGVALVLMMGCDGDESSTSDVGQTPEDQVAADAATNDSASIPDAVQASDSSPADGTSAETEDMGPGVFVDHSGLDTVADLVMQPDDFRCLLDMADGGRFRIDNPLGYLDEALEVAASAGGGRYPVGTVIQLVPQEAMVKRQAGFSSMTNDWEFFSLNPSNTGTEIIARGAEEMSNSAGNCVGCHSAAAQTYDMVCGDSHGCTPLGFTLDGIQILQNSDPRCL